MFAYNVVHDVGCPWVCAKLTFERVSHVVTVPSVDCFGHLVGVPLCDRCVSPPSADMPVRTVAGAAEATELIAT